MATSTPYVASLRVYEPLETFPERDRTSWLLRFGGVDSKDLEQFNSLRRTIFFESSAARQDGVHILEIDGKKFAAPWATSRRCWSALSEFKSSLPSSVSKFFLPREVEEALSLGIEDRQGLVPHILTETWMIPPRWFSLFTKDDRLSGEINGHPFVLVRTKLELAKQRALKAHRAVRKAFGPGPVEEELVELINWLNVFDTGSMLELDYGGLAIYLNNSLINSGEIGLEADTSIADVHVSIEGLESGDAVMAGSGYERLVSRWRRVSEYERAT